MQFRELPATTVVAINISKEKSTYGQRWCGKSKGPEKEKSKATWCE